LRTGDPKGAVRELGSALKLSSGDANIHYNLGLAYFELKDYEKATEQAKLAYGLGHPLTGLRDKLKRQGRWPD
jgi:tetratricopeptide (TPR) repeat protein